MIEKLKHKMSANTQLFSRYRKRQNQYYQNKMFRKTAGNFTENTNVKNAPTKEELDNFWKERFEKRFNTMKKLT